jgi:hypothetical protein
LDVEGLGLHYYDPKWNFPGHPTPGSKSTNEPKKYFVFQPSGGLSNQRAQLEYAMIICRLTKRICVAPPIAPHSNYFYNYNIIPAKGVISAQRIFNMEELNKAAQVVSIPEGMTFLEWLESLRSESYSFYKVTRDVKKFKPGTLLKWSEKEIKQMFADRKEQILYFANQTMWGTMEWKGLLGGYDDRKIVHSHLMYANHLKEVAKELSEVMGHYHAVHVRRGDKVTEANFKQVSHPCSWYESRIHAFISSTNKVYIATDEHNREMFDCFDKSTWKVYFVEDLPTEKIDAYLALYPERMRNDMTGVLEQLLCTYGKCVFIKHSSF